MRETHKRNSALYIRVTDIQMKHTLISFWEGPTTHYKKWEPPLQKSKVLPSYSTIPTIDLHKRRAYRVSFDNSLPLLETWQDTEGLLAIFRAWTSNPVLTKAKRMEKSNNYGIWLWLQFEPRGTTKFVGVRPRREHIMSFRWDPMEQVYPFPEVYEGGLLSGLTILEVSGGCVW